MDGRNIKHQRCLDQGRYRKEDKLLPQRNQVKTINLLIIINEFWFTHSHYNSLCLCLSLSTYDFFYTHTRISGPSVPKHCSILNLEATFKKEQICFYKYVILKVYLIKDGTVPHFILLQFYARTVTSNRNTLQA